MIYIYVSSTYPLYLGLYLKINENKNVHFLYTRKIYKEVFELLQLDATYINHPSLYSYFFKPRKVKSQIKFINKLIGTNELVFSHIQFATFLFVLLYNSPLKRRMVFYNLEPKTQNIYNANSIIKYLKSYIKAKLTQIVLKVQYQTSTKIFFYTNNFYIAIDTDKFKDINIIENKQESDFESIQTYVVKRIQLNGEKISNLYFAQNEINMKGNVFSEKEITILERFINDNKIVVKPHPSGYPYPKSYRTISKAVPSEFFFSSITNSVISINSSTIISASHYFWNNNSNNVKIICLMKLIPITDEQSNREIEKRMFERCKLNVLYPTSFEELKALII